MNNLILGDCLEEMKNLPDNSVDSVVTDPPYGLSFMGKKWDYGVPSEDVWRECLRVLKPGGHLLAFAGTRTQHRMAVRIEDAGFEIRDMIAWVYGCLSEDTEILTESGYKLLRKLTQYDKIAVYDITNNIYKWERPQRWSVYKVHQDTAYRIKSDYTDQIVSRNHRCLVEREGKLTFIQADELNEVEYMPTLSDDFYTLQEGHRKLLLKELLWKGKGLAQKLFSKWKGNKKSEERIEVRKEPSLERWSNLLEETRKLQADKICEVSEGVFTDGEKRWICNGTSFDNGSILGDMFRESPSSSSYQSRPTGQPIGKPDVISIKQGTQIIRRATVTKIEYSGIIFCPTVSTGAFVARRNGQVFITGNSGFPKSLNIGKAVDKLGKNPFGWLDFAETYKKIVEESKYNHNDIDKYLGIKASSCYWARKDHRGGLPPRHHWEKIKEFIGLDNRYDELYNEIEREILGQKEVMGKDNDIIYGKYKGGVVDITKGTSEWEGWGTALKPAVEPVGIYTKPLQVEQIIAIIISDLWSLLLAYGATQPSQDHLATLNAVASTVPESARTNLLAKLDNAEHAQNLITSLLLKSGKEKVSSVQESAVQSGDALNQATRTRTGKVAGVSLMDISISVQTEGISENTALSLSNILGELLGEMSTFTTETAIRKIIELKTLRCSLYQSISTCTGSENLSPSLEPITVARKPLIGTVAENVLTHGTGGLNIDQCRVAYTSEKDKKEGQSSRPNSTSKGMEFYAEGKDNDFNRSDRSDITGRFPANLIHDGSEEVVGLFPNSKGCSHSSKGTGNNVPSQNVGMGGGQINHTYGDDGSAARFFYRAKSSRKDRGEGNNHPTVKPTDLMRYLCRLVTPPGGTVLDPFMGSGSTGKAAALENLRFIGIEKEREYYAIAKKRIEAVHE